MSISRRSFIKGMGVGCVGCTVSSLPPGALAFNPVDSLKGQSTLTRVYVRCVPIVAR